MIAVEPYRKSLNDKDIEAYAGIKSIERECLNSLICRLEGEHGQHSYTEQILLTDSIAIPPKKDAPNKVDLPIRWYNFCYAYWQILIMAQKEQKALTQTQAVIDALVFSKLNCFDIDGSPSNIARAMQFKSYTKFNQMVTECANELEAKVFKLAKDTFKFPKNESNT